MYSFLTRFFSGRQPLFCLLVGCAFWLAGVPEAFAQDPLIPVQPLPSSPLPSNSLPSTVIPNSVPANGSIVVPANNAIQTVPAQEAVSEIPMIQKRMTPELLLKLGRLGGTSISPDGTQIAYTCLLYTSDAADE